MLVFLKQANAHFVRNVLDDEDILLEFDKAEGRISIC